MSSVALLEESSEELREMLVGELREDLDEDPLCELKDLHGVPG